MVTGVSETYANQWEFSIIIVYEEVPEGSEKGTKPNADTGTK
jgi:hypothetical protein